jgi:hypothetical protein
MIRLSHAMSKVIIDEYGQIEFLRRLSDPLWFQAFGCVLGFDWHSSGVTTVVAGVLKQVLKSDIHGISMAGGKGKKSTSAKADIPLLAENFGLSSAKTDSLVHASRMAAKNTLDRWLGDDIIDVSGYEMPRRLDWGLFKRIYDIQPRNYEELLSIQGLGGATVRALSLIAELIYGARASRNDPVKHSFAHGGKDGVPYPVARRVYDESIRYLYGAIEGAEIERKERTDALKKLVTFSEKMFPCQRN